MRTSKVAREKPSRKSKSRVVLSALVYLSSEEVPDPLVRFLDDDRVVQAGSVSQAVEIGAEFIPRLMQMHPSGHRMMRAKEKYFTEFMIVGHEHERVVDFEAHGQRYRLRIRIARKGWRSR